jgi:signal transduction histidine kinase
MTDAGAPAAEAHPMFDHGVLGIFLVATAIAVVVSAVLAAALAARFTRPLEEMARVARRIAAGDYQARMVRRQPDEIAALAESFNQMAGSLSEQEQERREFIANAAHELRTPLTNLHGYLEALRDGVIAPSPEVFASLREETERLLRLSRSLDTLAESADRFRPVMLEDVDLGPALISACELVRPILETRGIHLELRVAPGLRVTADPDQVAQVLGNLLQNASRYTPDGGRVALTAEVRGAEVLVAITNSGDGIPAPDLPHVFERFYRVEKSRDPARGGAGIGLAIVKQLVESAGGRVGAESREGATRFWFSLPA